MKEKHRILQIQQVVIIPATLSSVDHNLVLLLLLALVLRNRPQELFQLVLCHLLSQLARLGHHDQTVLDVGGARLFDETYPTQTVRGGGFEDLGENGSSSLS